MTFSSDQTTNSVIVNINDDSIVENLEQFTATLTVNRALNPGVTLNPSMATVNINDNDGKWMCINPL